MSPGGWRDVSVGVPLAFPQGVLTRAHAGGVMGGCSCAAHCAAARGRREPQRSGSADYQAGVFELEHTRRDFEETARCDAQQIDLTRGAAPPDEAAAPPRATQSEPPAIRRQVLLRDQKRCQVPSCRNTIALDVHHIQWMGGRRPRRRRRQFAPRITILVDVFSCTLRLEVAAREETASPRRVRSTTNFSRDAPRI
jgi:hypothetical protein